MASLAWTSSTHYAAVALRHRTVVDIVCISITMNEKQTGGAAAAAAANAAIHCAAQNYYGEYDSTLRAQCKCIC